MRLHSREIDAHTSKCSMLNAHATKIHLINCATQTYVNFRKRWQKNEIGQILHLENSIVRFHSIEWFMNFQQFENWSLKWCQAGDSSSAISALTIVMCNMHTAYIKLPVYYDSNLYVMWTMNARKKKRKIYCLHPFLSCCQWQNAKL